MTPTPNLLALDDRLIVNLAYLVEATHVEGNEMTPRHTALRYSNGSQSAATDPDGILFSRLRERAWPLLEKP